jgi:hypothetical protein
VFQGDIFNGVEIMVPRPSGGYRDYEPSVVMVMSHDCEWTKVEQYGRAYPLLIAPVRRLSSFTDPPGIQGHIRGNRVRSLLPLPPEAPLQEEHVVDLRLIQPITAAELLDEEFVTSVSDAIKLPLQGKLLVFFANRPITRAT